MKIRRILVLPLVIGLLFTTPVFAEELPPNPEGKEIPGISAGDDMYTNKGIITAVQGTLHVNQGEVKMVMPGGVVEVNWTEGLIGVNRGYVEGNKGTIDENNSLLDFNEGIVEENYVNGDIKENYKNVNVNRGRIGVNEYNGIVSNNTSVGTVEYNVGRVETNAGTINENRQSGRINTNDYGGKILKNVQNVYNNKGYIYNNLYPGSVTNNSGTVYNISGSVSNNTGTVYQRIQEGNIASEVKSIVYESGFNNYGDNRFIRQGGSGTISIEISDGYSLSDVELTYGDITQKEDGTYLISNVNAPTRLSVSVKKDSPKEDSSSTQDKEGASSSKKDSDVKSSYSLETGKYSVEGNIATFTAPTKMTARTVTIPATITAGGKIVKVTAIAPGAFKGMKNLTKVTIGKNIKSIGAKAFFKCKALKNIKIKTKKLTKKTIGSKAVTGISKKAVIKSPKAKKKAYKKILLKKGMKKTMTFK